MTRGEQAKTKMQQRCSSSEIQTLKKYAKLGEYWAEKDGTRGFQKKVFKHRRHPEMAEACERMFY